MHLLSYSPGFGRTRFYSKNACLEMHEELSSEAGTDLGRGSRLLFFFKFVFDQSHDRSDGLIFVFTVSNNF